MRDMKQTKRSILYIIIMIIAISLLFRWYTTSNNSRIENQNLNYAMDSSRQSANRIQGEFNNAMLRIRNYAFLLNVGSELPAIDTEILKKMESNAVFDAIGFTNSEGLTLLSDGTVYDASDREYFKRGMNGESGLQVIFDYRPINAGDTMMNFYAPLTHDGKVYGMLLGLYSAESYLQNLLETNYFGTAADVYLCMPDGKVIATSSGEKLDTSAAITDILVEKGVIDGETALEANKVIESGSGSGGFICPSGYSTDNLCVTFVPGDEYVLVQTFPQSVTSAMTSRANRTGIILQAILISLFVVYIILLLVRARKSRKILEQENLELGYVLRGVNTLFSRFTFADLDKNTYKFMAGASPELANFPAEGKYGDLTSYFSTFLNSDEELRLDEELSPETIKASLKDDDNIQLEYQTRRGDVIGWEHMNVICIERDENGDACKLILCRQDITALKEKEMEQTRALKEALLQAQHANNAKSTFLSSMSHDIRTPMNAIIGFTTIAVSHIDNKEQVRECLQKVLSSSNHLLSLINDILDMSRIESGKVQIKEQECNISELTHNLVNIIQPQVKAKQMELYIDTFDVANEDIIADPLKLSQVFVNILSNAVKYTPAGGTVSFRIIQETTFHRGYGDYEFIIKDNGVGMSPEFVEHIFEPFERESSATKSGIQGTGLGMAITKNIIDMMGGEITVKSEKGKGSEFRVKLSLKLQDVAQNAAQIKELEGLRALVVDDDLDSCDSVDRMLKQIGMRSEWTTSGREAVYRAKSAYNAGDSYHTYIIDWQMPEMSGVETARRIRLAIGDEAPIIILTAYDWTDIEEDAKQAGVTAFCSKPLFMSDLKSVLLAANNLIGKEGDAPPAWTQEDFSGKRILLVEDNELNREIAQTILEETGFVVECAPDGTDAVRMMQNSEENYYDAILMDVQMPVMDGYEATRNIRSMPRKDAKNIPIIAMTANAMEEDKENALNSGMNAHISKPLDIDLFIAMLAKFLKEQ